ncbi:MULTISPECIES: spore coat protein GerQ [Bacillaceae]|uniref:Spore coat protein GerQ n=1 Tax=Alkalicoccobacillus plakortidis TaxID=444060 RepID=A0A9D5DX88_9BACI|nr:MULTISPECIES: spore coat protein GerQ [Bacillaceae]KQL58875.1 spore coat protein GerQ [Alkalicoccobacillus plakortidis]RQW18922.1 spore coat protein GerQ [Bacillus sp. C1-1]
MYQNQWQNQGGQQGQGSGQEHHQGQPMQGQSMQGQPMYGQQSMQQQSPQPYFSSQNYQTPGFVQQQMSGVDASMLPIEQSFIENILRLNRGKLVTVHQTFEGNSEWNARVFRGRIEEAGRDHIIIGNPETGEYYLLLMVNLDFITFDEPIDYTYQYGYEPSLSQYSPR